MRPAPEGGVVDRRTFLSALSDLGYAEGRNITFEYRWAEGKLGQLPELASDLVRLKVDVIVTLAPPAAHAAKSATQMIPIVFVAIGDPVASGLVANFARPGGNLTGTTRMTSEMSIKHFGVLPDWTAHRGDVRCGGRLHGHSSTQGGRTAGV
jgi:putative ABC transport system substrate-binding protein